jgi:hypothetical protein
MFRGGEAVRVPSPDGEGTVLATFIAPAGAGRDVSDAWVRYDGGPQSGANARVPFSEIAACPASDAA